jgi:NADPH-dependent 2,4-dienoyl-CoA reductase/sulfur reductase-like enzyme
VRDVVVVGGGVAAVRLAEQLRRLGSDDRIVLVGAEAHVPYDRPPLTKKFLEQGATPPTLGGGLADLGVQMRLGRQATGLDTGARTVTLDDASTLGYDELVVATGATPRSMPELGEQANHVMRTLDDATALRADLLRTGRVVVVGAGFIGCELASTARALGADVTLLEMLPVPLGRVLGTEVGALVADRQRGAGVDLRCGTTVTEVVGDGDERELLLSDGARLAAPVVVAALGVAPACGWLAGSGVQVDDGVVCDSTGRASAPGVWAIGDAARWWHPPTGRAVRFEHWTSAVDQARAVAGALMGTPTDVDPVP